MSEKDHNASLAADHPLASPAKSDAATARHTPGPWCVRIDENNSADAHAVGVIEASGDGYVIADVWGAVEYLEKSKVANAHLIAAAPEMYKALKHVAAILSSAVWNEQKVLVWSLLDLEQALAAIAKAEGRE
jgi:GTP:adenosylcobinamide-phosphate guanylyltransferase